MSTATAKRNRQGEKVKQVPLKKQPWSPQKYQAFAKEIDEIGQEVRKRLGEKDLKYLKNLKRNSNLYQVLGRTLLQVSLDPFTWSWGVFFLFLHLQLESIEIGHFALHGSWDTFESAKKFHAKNFKWNISIDEKSWDHGHNILHHHFTNIVEKDPDVNFNFMRMSKQTPWRPYHLVQLMEFFLSAPIFHWGLSFYFTGFGEFLRPGSSEGYAKVLPKKDFKTFIGSLKPALKKAIPYGFKNFLFWPLLAGPFWWKVLMGNLTADALRSIWCAASIYPGHFGDELEYHDKSFRPHGRGEYYRSQVQSSRNFKVPKVISVLCGAMDFQIEHHLFPKFPPNRLREIAPKVEAICKKYGIPYHAPSWGKALGRSLKRITEFSLPPSLAKRFSFGN